MTDLFRRGPTDPRERLVWRLGCLGIVAADTSPAAVRQAILDAAQQTTVYGRGDTGRVVTYAQRFEEVYGEPLAVKPRRKNAAV